MKPDALALRRYSDELLALRELDEVLARRLDSFLEAQAKLDAAGIVAIEARFGPEMSAALQVRRGEAFWDRSPPDPTPAALTGESRRAE